MKIAYACKYCGRVTWSPWDEELKIRVTDANQTYCGNHFTIDRYIYQMILLHTLDMSIISQ